MGANDFKVDIGDLKSLSSMMDDAKTEAETLRKAMGEYVKDHQWDLDSDRVITLIHDNYAEIAESVEWFCDQAIEKLGRVSEELADTAKEYEGTDKDGAERLDKSFDPGDDWYMEVPEYSDGPGGAVTSDAPDERADVDDMESKRFKYHFTDSPVTSPKKASEGADYRDPHEHFEKGLVADKELRGFCAGWGMDIDAIVNKFKGKWWLAHARANSLTMMSHSTSCIAENIDKGRREISETWDGQAAAAVEKYLGFLADSFRHPNSDLQDMDIAYGKCISDIYDFAEEVAWALEQFLKVASVLNFATTDATEIKGANTITIAGMVGEIVAGATKWTVRGSSLGMVVEGLITAGSVIDMHKLYWPLRWAADAVFDFPPGLEQRKDDTMLALDNAAYYLKDFGP